MVNVQVSKDTISNLLCSAIEAGRTYGCGYWCFADQDKSKRPPVLENQATGALALQEVGDLFDEEVWYIHWPLFEGGALVFTEHNDEDKVPVPVDHTLDLETIYKGLAVMANKYPHRFAEVMSDEIDGPLGEEFLQCCFFNELKYG